MHAFWMSAEGDAGGGVLRLARGAGAGAGEERAPQSTFPYLAGRRV